MANTMMFFPETVEEFMEQNKIVDTEQIYTNGVELVPIFRMKQWFISHPCEDGQGDRMIDKEDAIAIVKVVLSHHFHPDYNEELKSEVFSAWDWELLEISKEICKRIREEVEDGTTLITDRPYKAGEGGFAVHLHDNVYCDRNICTKNEYNGVSCDECEVAKYHNLEDDDSPCRDCGEEE